METRWLLASILFGFWTAVGGAEETSLRISITRDTWFSCVGHEGDCNLGGAGRLKLKSIQEMSLVDFDPAPLRGRVVTAAAIHLRLASANAPLRRVTVSSFAADWVEGTATNYAPQRGSSCFNFKRYPDVPWAYPGSDLTAVMLGQGGTIWHSADASPRDAEGWQIVPIDPRVIAARVAGISYGLLLFDDTGSEWTRRGERFDLHVFPNRFVYSRHEGNHRAPCLTVTLGENDRDPPAAPTGLRDLTGENEPPGEAIVRWDEAKDRGLAGIAGHLIEVDGRPVPQYLIGRPRPGGPKLVRLRDLGLAPGQQVAVNVRAVDGAGNIGPAASVTVKVSGRKPKPLLGPRPTFDQKPAALPKLGEAEIAIVDALDKVHPVSGRMTPSQPDGYLSANHIWSAGRNEIRLYAARGEFVDFQIVVKGAVRGIRARMDSDRPHPNPIPKGEGTTHATFWRYRCVNSKQGPISDPVVPLSQAVDMPDLQQSIAGQTYSSLLCEVYVSKDAAAGIHQTKLVLTAQDTRVEIPVQLNIWNFALPDKLHFLPEMNCYGLPENERDYYRLAHLHRTVLDRVPYHQNGHVAEGCAPKLDGTTLDWTDWDKRFGPYLDGTAFADLPRGKTRLEIFYLPIHENWPTPMEGNYNGNYWADKAFPKRYRDALVEVSRQMAGHFVDKGWIDTWFLYFWNNKNNFKERGWSRGSSPWLLDEPANFQDYWALHWFGDAVFQGAPNRYVIAPSAEMLFRCDISRPEWQRDVLDDVLRYNVIGNGPFRKYHRIVMERKEAVERQGAFQIVLDYGSTNAIENSNMQPVGWCLDSWSLGSNGVVPWQTIGNDNSWKHADQLSLFYPGRPIGQDKPVASIRLKAYRRGQQDTEYLELLAEKLHEPRWAIQQAVREALHLKGERRGTGFAGGEDAGIVTFDKLLPQDAWALRMQVAKAISP